MSLMEDIGSGMLGVVLLIVSLIILFFGVWLLLSGHWVVGLILIIIGGGVAISSRQRIHGH